MDRFAFLQCLPYFHEYRGKKWPPTLKILENDDGHHDGTSLVTLPLFSDQRGDREMVVSIEAALHVEAGDERSSSLRSKTRCSLGPIGFSYGTDVVNSKDAGLKLNSKQSTSFLDPCLCRFDAVLTNLQPPDAAELGLMSASSPSGSSTTTTTHVSGSQSSISAQGSAKRNPGRSLLSSLLSTTPKSAATLGQGKSPYSTGTHQTLSQGRVGCSPRMVQSLSPDFDPHLFFRFDEQHTVFVDYSHLKSVRFEDESSEGKRPSCLLLDFDGCSFRVFSQSRSSLHERKTSLNLTPTVANHQLYGTENMSSSLLHGKNILTKFFLGMPCSVPGRLEHDEDESNQAENFLGENSDPSSNQPGQREDSGFDHDDPLDRREIAETQAISFPGSSEGLFSKPKERGTDSQKMLAHEGGEPTTDSADESAEKTAAQQNQRKELLNESMSAAFETELMHSNASCEADYVLDAAEEIIHPLYRKRKRMVDQGWLAVESIIAHEQSACNKILDESFSKIESTFTKRNADPKIHRQEFEIDLQNCDGACDELDTEMKSCLETLFPGPRTRGSRGLAASTRSKLNQDGDTAKDEAHRNIIHLMRKRQLATTARHLIVLEGFNKV